MNKWQEVNDSSPFTDVEAVDGIVYTGEVDSPELRMPAPNRSAATQSLTYRQPPTRPQQRTLGPWKPGGEIAPDKFKAKPRRVSPVSGILIGLIPLAVLIGLLLLVVDLYGMK